jgi:hypothetical protein
MFSAVKASLKPVKGLPEPLDNVDINAIRSIVGSDLPASYVSFLKIYGRSMFEGCDANVVLPEGGKLPIFVFFGKGGPGRNVLEDLEHHPEYVEADYLPIADDLFNNRFVIDLRSGEIVHLQYGDGKVEVTKVADDFEHFLEQIEVVPADS